MRVVLDLTEKEAEKLVDVLNDYQDAGSDEYGYKSELLGELAAKVEIAVEAAKAA